MNFAHSEECYEIASLLMKVTMMECLFILCNSIICSNWSGFIVETSWCFWSHSLFFLQALCPGNKQRDIMLSVHLTNFYSITLMFVRDDMYDFYQQFYNSETRPNTAVHSVFFMQELQRYIMTFLGPERSIWDVACSCWC